MDRLLENLNEAQKEAVLTTEGAVMAIAGAGSGKTRVLTRRLAHLIFNLGVAPEQLLAITFTNKAANEMKVRVSSILNISTRNMWVSTFHSMCARILREHIELLGYNKHFQIIDDDDTVQLIKVILKRLDIDPKMVKPKMLKSHLMKLKFDSTLLDDYDEPLKGYLESVFPAYQKALKESNLVDFEDLLILVIELLRDHKSIRKHYQLLFKYILVDEFQDTNDVQYELIRLLVNQEHPNVFIVGDEDQSIYAFRGANINNIRKFKGDYDNVKQILLEQNYRSTNHILKAANGVIKCNPHRIDKTLFSEKGDGELVTVYKGYTHRDETDYVADTIRALLKKDVDYKDIGILYRANATSRTFEETLMYKNIPYNVVGNMSFFKRKEVKDMVAYLRLILNPGDNYSFTRVVNEPRRGIGAKTVERLALYAENEHISMFDAIDDADNGLPKAASNKLRDFMIMIGDLQSALATMEFNPFMDQLVKVTGYKEMLKTDDMGDIRLENIMELKSMIQEAKKDLNEDKVTILTKVLEDIALKSQEDENKADNAVTLMTLHAAKGLEFKVVFIVACEQGMFPLHQSMESVKDLAEERRLMYVGMTRAMDKLYITNARSRQVFGELRMHQDSQFIQEISKDFIEFEGLNKAMSHNPTGFKPKPSARPNRPSFLDDIDEEEVSENDVQKGDKVTHSVFGKGVVVTVTGEQCTIAFSKEFGIKTLLKNHQAIKKV